MTAAITKATTSAAKAAWARLPEKSRRGVVAQAYARVLDMLDDHGEAPLLAVLEALFPEEALNTARLALKTQFSNRPPKCADGTIALQLKNSRVSLQGGAAQAESFADAVVWFEVPSTVQAESIATLANIDVTERFGETLAMAMLGSEAVEHAKSEDLRKAELAQAESKTKAALNQGSPFNVHGIPDDEEFSSRSGTEESEFKSSSRVGTEASVFEESLAKRAQQLIAGDSRGALVANRNEPDENHPIALHAMLKWAQETSSNSRRLLVLLGDYGTGKTSHGQQFTRILNNKITHPKWPRNASDKNTVNALFIDLSELSGINNLAALSLEEMLVLALKKRDGLRITNVADVAPLLADARAGRLIMVFDGLDELLKNDSLVLHKVFDQILRVVEPAPEGTSTQQPKAIISCRSHYFRDVEAQHSFFTARRRGGVGDQDYLMLTLLPWGNDLIERYLTKRLGDDAPRLIKIIHNTYNLEELASRPVLLGMMSEHIMALLQKSDDGSKIAAADLYNLTVASWIERDNGKHRIQGHQKPLLMGALAAAMLDDGVESWPADKLDAWLQRTVNRLFPGTYDMKELASIQEDLRTATFIVRTGARDFSFAHKSYAEYFVARFILDGVDQVRYAALAVEDFHALLPDAELNREAMQFLTELWSADCRPLLWDETVRRVELLVGVLQREKPLPEYAGVSTPQRLLRIAKQIFRNKGEHAYLLHQSLWRLLCESESELYEGLELRSVSPINLRDLNFESNVWRSLNFQRFPKLDLRGADLRGVHAIDVKFGRVQCNSETNWSQAIMRNCDATNIEWNDAERTGLRLRATNPTINEYQLKTPLNGPWTLPLVMDLHGLIEAEPKLENVDYAATSSCEYLLSLKSGAVERLYPSATNLGCPEITTSSGNGYGLTADADGWVSETGGDRAYIGEAIPEITMDQHGAIRRRYSVRNAPPTFDPSWAEFDDQWRLVAYNDAAAEHWLFRIRDGVAEPIEAAL